MKPHIGWGRRHKYHADDWQHTIIFDWENFFGLGIEWYCNSGPYKTSYVEIHLPFCRIWYKHEGRKDLFQ